MFMPTPVPMWPNEAGPPAGIGPSFETVFRPVRIYTAPQQYFWLPPTIGSSDYPWLRDYAPVLVSVQRNDAYQVWPQQTFYPATFLPAGPKLVAVGFQVAQFTISPTSFQTVTHTLNPPITATFHTLCELIIKVIPAPVTTTELI